MWRIDDAATWHPWFSPGPVDVILVGAPDERGYAEVKITTQDIAETGEIWAADLTELDPVE